MLVGIGSTSSSIITTTADWINGYNWLSFDLTQRQSRDYVEAKLHDILECKQQIPASVDMRCVVCACFDCQVGKINSGGRK